MSPQRFPQSLGRQGGLAGEHALELDHRNVHRQRDLEDERRGSGLIDRVHLLALARGNGHERDGEDTRDVASSLASLLLHRQSGIRPP